jgi:hypothetical protein
VDKPSKQEIRKAAEILEEKTGKPVAFWIPLLEENPFEKFDEMVAQLSDAETGKRRPALA